MSKVGRWVVAALAALSVSPRAVEAQRDSYQLVANHFTLPEGRTIGSAADELDADSLTYQTVLLA
jgi:hypothetical protein